MLELRSLKLEEMAAYNALSSICFTIPTRTEDLSPKAMPPEKLREMRGVFDESGALLGGMIMIEMNCRFERHDCRFLGVGGVVADPAQRRRGAIRKIFESDLPRLRDEGFVLSALYPFSHEFYRKFGYELGILRRDVKISPRNLRSDLHRAASIRRILPEEPDGGMKQVYDQYIADKNLAVLRDVDHWKALRSGTPWENHKYSYVLYDESGAPMAYWVGAMTKGSDGNTMNISDMAYTCRAGMESIFAMIRTMNEIACIAMAPPQDMPYRYLVSDPWNVQETVTCGGMVRIMDVKKALTMLPAPAMMGRCAIEVADGQIPENNGRFAIISDGESLAIARTEDDPDLSCTINGLSALAISGMGLQQCLDAGLARMNQPSAGRFLAELFRPRQQHLHNFF